MIIFNFCLLLVYILFSTICLESLAKTFSNLINFQKCKLSHMGLDFQGSVSKTESFIPCQSWTANKPIHVIDSAFTDDKFSDFSIRNAKNYCRNPDKNPSGPWCYTTDSQLINETCLIPLCQVHDCKITGPGMEYFGTIAQSISGHSCVIWNKNRKQVRKGKNIYEQKKFQNMFFPDEDITSAKKSCRNPDGDIGGPWCFVEVNDDSKIVQKEYCDIAFCDEPDCMVFARNTTLYSHYTKFNKILTNLTFGIKLWDPDSFLNAEARLVLSLLPLPVDEFDMKEMEFGIEILISNKGSGLISNKNYDLEPSYGILKSANYTLFSLTWGEGLISLNILGSVKPIFFEQFNLKNSLLGFHKDQFYYYSLKGANILWILPFCEEDLCEIHTTNTIFFERFWPLHETNTGYDIQFFVRGVHSVYITLFTSPTIMYPRIEIVLNLNDNRTQILLHEEDDLKTILKEKIIYSLLNYWLWQEMSITVFSNEISLFWTKDTSTRMILNTKNINIDHMRWFSIGSDNTVAHWSLYCSPLESDRIPPAWPPECTVNVAEAGYKGSQWIADSGEPCLPWSSPKYIPTEIQQIELFQPEDIFSALNYCRNPSKDENGSYCFIINHNSEFKVSKKYCNVRKCKSSECKMAGTGNDYIGKLNVTRSNRTCQNWDINDPHTVKNIFLNATLFAEQSYINAENYCRNPSRSIAGSWCYTTDPNVEIDLCNVKDCDKQEQSIVLMRGNGLFRYTYILPQWKETGIHGGLHFWLKEWDPDMLDGIYFLIFPQKGEEMYKLLIGSENNEKIELYYGKSISEKQLLKEKTFPHLIPAGKWNGLWLQVPKGKVLVGYSGETEPLFEWEHENISNAFEPFFLSYMSLNGNTIGVSFKNTECHIENSTMTHMTRIMPIGLWSEEEHTIYNNITIYLRGTGVALIPLILLPNDEFYYALTIGDWGKAIYFIKNTWAKAITLVATALESKMLTVDSWTVFNITFNETVLTVKRNGTEILKYFSETPMLFYWFSVGAEKGWITWAVNCIPDDIDGPPVDGGWSEWSDWQCSVSCGGGNGFRTRTCTKPRPNIFGKLCDGSSITTGRCNEFVCGDLSPNTLESIHVNLQTQNFHIEISEGEKVLIENYNDIIETISIESPKAYFEWTLNGVLYNLNNNRTKFLDNNILIISAKPEDNGVYTSILYRINSERIIMRVVSLAVIPKKYNMVFRETDRIYLRCSSVVLGYVYSDLRQKWLLNDSVYINYGTTTLIAVNIEQIILNHSHTGIWKCVVEQNELKFTWVTNVTRLLINNRANFFTHLMEDELTKKIFKPLKTKLNIIIFIIFVIIFIFFIVICILYSYFRWGTLPSTQYNKLESDS